MENATTASDGRHFEFSSKVNVIEFFWEIFARKLLVDVLIPFGALCTTIMVSYLTELIFHRFF